MIEFHCPRCRAAYRTDDSRAGEKFNCPPPCGQRMEIPRPPLPPPSPNKTVLAPLTGVQNSPPAPLPEAPAPLAIIVYPTQPQPQETAIGGLGIASFVMSLMSFLIWLELFVGFIFCVAGLVLGIVRKRQRRDDPLATAGMVISLVNNFIVIALLLAIVLAANR